MMGERSRLEPLGLVIKYLFNIEANRRWTNIIEYTLKGLSCQERRDEEFKSNFCRNFCVVNSLGGGSFGLVYKVEKIFCSGNEFDVVNFQPDGYSFQKHFAIKLVPNYKQQLVMNELKHLSALVHPNIVRCYNAWVEIGPASTPSEWQYLQSLVPEEVGFELKAEGETLGSSCQNVPRSPDFLRSCLFLQYELCGDGNLEDLLKDRMNRNRHHSPDQDTINLDYKETQNIFMQILEGLVYLEYSGIVHDSVYPKTGLKVKIGDFGLSMQNEEVQALKDPKNFADVVIDPFTPRQKYHAPEYLKGLYTIRGDIYALGLIFMTMLGQYESKISKDGSYLFIDRYEAVLDAMYKKNLRKYPKDLELQFPVEFAWIKKMTSHTESKRPSPYQLKRSIQEASRSDLDKTRHLAVTVTALTNVDTEVKSPSFGNYETNYGDKFGQEAVYSILSFATFFLESSDFKNAYRYFSDFIHEGLGSLEVENQYLLIAFVAIVTVGITMNKFEDIYYLGYLYVPRLEAKLGQDDPRTLEAQMALFTALKKLSMLPQTVNSPPDVIQNFTKLQDQILNSPAVLRLPLTSPVRLENLVWKCWLALFTHDENRLSQALQDIEQVLEIRLEIGEKSELANDYLLKGVIMEQLDRSSESAQLFRSSIDEIMSTFGVSTTQTFILVRGYGDLLTRLGHFSQARPYREAQCKLYQGQDHYICDIIQSYQELILIYDKLGLQAEVDFILRYCLYHHWLRNAFYMVKTKRDVMNTISIGFPPKMNIDEFIRKSREEYGLSPCTRFYQSTDGNIVMGYGDEGEGACSSTRNEEDDRKCHPQILEMALDYWDYLQTRKVELHPRSSNRL